MTHRGLGWKPEIPDGRDAKFALNAVGRLRSATLPLAVDLRSKLPPAQDQGATSSCVGHACAGLLDFLRPDPAFASGAEMLSSRRFIYWRAREVQGWTDRDEGCYIRDGMKSVAAGVPHELACRFSQPKINTRPNKIAFTQASRRRKIGTYHPVSGLAQMKACLAEGFPFVGGVTVYGSFFTANDGTIPMPGDEAPEGGHAILFVGYDDGAKRLIFRNSWGPGWGEAGSGTIPYDYVIRDGADFWTARL